MKTKHFIDYCGLCQCYMVRCGVCNNNCCNGGSGEIDGVTCQDCLDAYAIQDLYDANPDKIEFAGYGRSCLFVEIFDLKKDLKTKVMYDN